MILSKATIENIAADKYSILPIVVPDAQEQYKIYNYIRLKSEQAERAVGFQLQLIEKLKKYKATLINSAVTGKIKITPDMVEG